MEHGFHGSALQCHGTIDSRNGRAVSVGDRTKSCVSVGAGVKYFGGIYLGVNPMDDLVRGPRYPFYQRIEIVRWRRNGAGRMRAASRGGRRYGGNGRFGFDRGCGNTVFWMGRA